ncbi:protein turtle isoform X3 [Aphidius gifuensis]|uniref:protein turtle isoform X3 n=1 Tax=Aphidius gifuensis TaxID=684658 RepID=UPI001CDB55FB|nr:protein turtle isoform X3 [Aphidius gifuensis]XP_044008136.1 protein turtle isoform X3 [Aphidius gifuensis]
MGGGGGLNAKNLRRRNSVTEFCKNNDNLIFKTNVIDNDVSNEYNENDRLCIEATVGINSGQPTCIVGIGIREKCKSIESESETWNNILENKLEDRCKQRRRRGRRRKRRIQTHKFDVNTMRNNITNDDHWIDHNNSDNVLLIKKKQTTICQYYYKCMKKITEMAVGTLLLSAVLLVTPGFCHQDAVHITAILGESVVFNCHVEFPGEHPVPYVLQWEKKEIPIYIWYESYPTHSGDGYEGRVSRVGPNSPYGVASLNLTNIRESDQGWYECKVVFLNRSPNSPKNGTWFHLDVHAPPRFSMTPEEMIYVNVGDAIILNCQAEGTPTPEIVWYKDANPVSTSPTIGIFNEGTELRIASIKNEDIGDYTCIARNGEGQISHSARVVIAGGAVIMVPPTNQTKLEGERVQFPCEAKALPGNVTVRWFREGAPVTEVSELDTRVSIKKDGSLVINPVSADDTGQYLCEVTNGIGEPQSASAYLNVEYPAKVTFTPTIQYLPFRLAGVVQCYIKANPPLQYVTWTKDKRLLEPYQTKDIVIMNNGSLLFTRVNENHQGKYTCTPYNAHGTHGGSGPMDVLVRNPPVFTLEPEPMYQRKIGETVDMVCDAQEAEGTEKPTIQWQRRNGVPLERNRGKITGGNLTIDGLRRNDFGYYQCVAWNEVATIISATQLIVEGSQPHAPHNVTGISTQFSVTLQWLPGYSGGPDYKQDYTVWYREAGTSAWTTNPVTPSGSTFVTINNLSPGTLYEFQVVGKNAISDGMLSKVTTIRTLDVGINPPSITTPKSISVKAAENTGPKPGPPRNLTVTEVPNGFLITWQHPLEKSHLIEYYDIKYKTDGAWKTLNKGHIRSEETSYLVKNLVGGRTYYFQVFAHSSTTPGTSELVKFPVPARVKHKAITAGVVGGILFFIVAIILSICAVKICNKRKRRKQEKELLSAYNLVACRVTDARNGAGQGPQGTVPLKKNRQQSRVPGLSLLRDILNPDSPDSCRCRPLSKISRAADGRFVIADSVLSSANNSILDASSSDDGGFLPKKNRLKSSWRRPLVGTSQLSLRSDGSGVSIVPGTAYINNLLNPLMSRQEQKICTISSPGFIASSPSGQIIWTTNPSLYLNDLSSVRQPSSVEPSSFPTTSPDHHIQLRNIHQRYSQELPSLKAIHAESRRFVPVQPLATSSPPQPIGGIRPRARLPPRHARHARSAPELAISPDILNINETSPESRSSSSGFGSKNTSQQNQSSRSGSTVAEWRPPPYRPPPPPLLGRWLELQDHQQIIDNKISHKNNNNSNSNNNNLAHIAIDVGSVDGHYEFDPVSCTPTPTSASTPTREERPPVHQIHTIHLPHMHQVHTTNTNNINNNNSNNNNNVNHINSNSHSNNNNQPSRYSRDNIEARVQAMKAEFHQFRQRQARRKRSQQLESAC